MWFVWSLSCGQTRIHYSDVRMGAMASQFTSLTIVYSTVYSGADQRKHRNSASLAFVRGIHQWPVNSPHKWPITRKMFPFDDVIVPCSASAIWWPIAYCTGYFMTRLDHILLFAVLELYQTFINAVKTWYFKMKSILISFRVSIEQSIIFRQSFATV